MKNFLFTLVLTALSFTVMAQTIEEVPAKPRILLALESTPFKNALVREMQSLLEKEGVEVTVVSNSQKDIAGYQAASYAAVFITNSGVNSRLRPWIVEWLDANRSYRDRILLHTTQTRDWQVLADVDNVTSASLKSGIAELAQQYTQLLLRKPSPAPAAME